MVSLPFLITVCVCVATTVTVISAAGVSSSTLRGRRRSLTRIGNGPLTPTASQIKWQKSEIMALVHFNMATFFRNGGTFFHVNEST